MAEPELVATADQLARQTSRIASEIDAAHPNGVTLVGVLKGSLMFMSDLVRRLTVPTRVEFVALAPYDGTTTRTRVLKDLDGPIEGDAVVLVTAIVDTGLTADFLFRHLSDRGPASIHLATLADKAARRLLPVEVHHAAVVAPDRFLVGYGLDYAGRYRNLAGLWAADGQALASDPDALVPALYGWSRS